MVARPCYYTLFKLKPCETSVSFRLYTCPVTLCQSSSFGLHIVSPIWIAIFNMEFQTPSLMSLCAPPSPPGLFCFSCVFIFCCHKFHSHDIIYMNEALTSLLTALAAAAVFRESHWSSLWAEDVQGLVFIKDPEISGSAINLQVKCCDAQFYRGWWMVVKHLIPDLSTQIFCGLPQFCTLCILFIPGYQLARAACLVYRASMQVGLCSAI